MCRDFCSKPTGPAAICYLKGHRAHCLILTMALTHLLRQATALRVRRQPEAGLVRKCCTMYWASPRLIQPGLEPDPSRPNWLTTSAGTLPSGAMSLGQPPVARAVAAGL